MLRTELSFHEGASVDAKHAKGVPYLSWIRAQDSGTSAVIYLTREQCAHLGAKLLAFAAEAEKTSEVAA